MLIVKIDGKFYKVESGKYSDAMDKLHHGEVPSSDGWELLKEYLKGDSLAAVRLGLADVSKTPEIESEWVNRLGYIDFDSAKEEYINATSLDEFSKIKPTVVGTFFGDLA